MTKISFLAAAFADQRSADQSQSQQNNEVVDEQRDLFNRIFISNR
jgi:hypothetical protein